MHQELHLPDRRLCRKLGARPRKIASLYVGRRDGERVLYAGKAGTGYTEKVARKLREKLDPLIVRTSPLAVPVKKPKATWVKEIGDAEIEYGALTDDGSCAKGRLQRAARRPGVTGGA